MVAAYRKATAACGACAHAPACRRQTYVGIDTETAGSETASTQTASAKTEAADR